MNKITKTILITLIGATTLFGCKTEKTVTTVTKESVVPEEVVEEMAEEVAEEVSEEIGNECAGKVSYTASIKPIMESACVKCHSGANPKHGIDLTTFENVKKATGHGLLCTVQGGERCPKMPPFGGSLSKEEVNKIDCWITNGMVE